ncbi:MAG: aminotransferase class I/II-fold pyridoxal phosphate-dependent enzyme [Prevotella sp.]
MQAIILAAGMGKRLGEYTKNNTKCMVPVNGVPLIDRVLNQLSSLKLSRVVIVVGYEGQKLIDHIGNEYNGLKIEYIFNSIYDKTNNIYSLALAKDKMQEDDTLLLESDLIFDDRLFSLVVDNPCPNLALVAKYEAWMDGTMVQIDDERNIVNFVPKEAFRHEQADSYYKTVNIYKLSKEFSANRYVPFLEAYMKAIGNNEYYENVLRILSFLDCKNLKALPITDEKWYEIDDKQDLDIAEALFADDEQLMQKFYSRYGGFWRFPKMLDFCYLVNPFFPSQRMLDEMKTSFQTLLTEYPSGMKVNTLLASKCWGVSEKYIVPGNGAAELIKILMDNLNGKLGVIRPSFEEYPNRYQGEVVTFIPQNSDFRYTGQDIIDYYANKDIANLLLINPDNPSGNFIPKDDILKVADWCKLNQVRFIVDESFVDFSEDYEICSMLDDTILESYPNMIVVKSISKSYGVPGLRLGIMASADEILIKEAKKYVSIWNINSFAEFFMQIFTKYSKDYHKACGSFQAERADFLSKLYEIPFIHVMPTQANFVLCEVKEPYSSMEIVKRMLREHNILLSACSAKKGLQGGKYLRIAIRGHQDNARLIEAFKQL